MSNDLISRSHFDDRVRLAAGPDADEEFSADFLDGVKTVLYMLSTEPAVPQEMSAREFAKAFRRMCDSYDVNGHNSCEGCEVWRENICCLCDMPDIIPIVEKWAREHPEERSEE